MLAIAARRPRLPRGGSHDATDHRPPAGRPGGRCSCPARARDRRRHLERLDAAPGHQGRRVAGGIAADGSGLTIVGTTGGHITHNVRGGSDAFIRRYDRTGKVLWTRQFGTDAQDIGQDVAADAGGLTVLGSTDGSFSGSGGTLGINDLFVRRYDRNGHEDGPASSARRPTRTRARSRPAMAGCSSSGRRSGALTGTNAPDDPDAFVRRYDRSGHVEWTRQFGTTTATPRARSTPTAAACSSAGAPTATSRAPNAGPFTDAYLRRYDTAGHVLWTRQWGQEGDDQVLSVAADSTGVTAVGYTHADATGNEPSQAFIRRYDRDGPLAVVEDLRLARLRDRLGRRGRRPRARRSPATPSATSTPTTRAASTSSSAATTGPGRPSGSASSGRRRRDLGIDVAADGKGFTILGHTMGALGGDAKGNLDVFVRRYTR